MFLASSRIGCAALGKVRIRRRPMETIEITKVLTGRKVEVKKSVNHGAPSLATVSFDDFNATDRRVALQVGNIFERSGSKFKLKSFGVAVAPAGQTGTSL